MKSLVVLALAVPFSLFGSVAEDVLSRKFSSYASMDMGEYLYELCAKRIAEMDIAADEAWNALKTKEAAAEYRAQLKEKMIAAIGGFPERTPLNARTVSVHKRDGYTIEGIVFESRPGHYVTAQLFLPSGGSFKPPYPGVLISCGHTFEGKAGPHYQRAAVVSAKHGFATLIFDPVDQGERDQIPGAGLKSVYGHVNAGLRAHLVGWGTAQFRLWDGIRALDLLAARPEVDSKRLGVTGMSGGGTMSAYLNAVDWRFSAACPAGFLTAMRNLCDKCGPQDCEQIIHGQLGFGLNHLSLMLMNADSALCPQFTYGDFFSYSGSMQTLFKAKSFRASEGKAGFIDHFECAGPHHWYESQKKAYSAWFRKHLSGDDSAWPPDVAKFRQADIGFDYSKVDCGLAGTPECEVLSGKGVMSLPGSRSVYDVIEDEVSRLEAGRSRVAPSDVVKVAGIRLGDAKGATECARSVVESEGVKAVTAVLEMPDRARIPVAAFLPAAWKGGAPVVFAGDAIDKKEYILIVEKHLSSGRAVAVVEMRGFGESALVKRNTYWTGRSSDEELAAMLSWMGENLVARRAEDLMAAADWFSGLVGGAKLAVESQGRAVIPAAHAYFVRREMFDRFSSASTPPSWTRMVKERTRNLSFSELVYGGLKSYDWIDLVR